MSSSAPQRPSLVGLVILTGLLGWGALHTGPLMHHGDVQIVPAMLSFIAGLNVLRIATESLNLIARLADRQSAKRPRRLPGSARWASWKDWKAQRSRKGISPLWGLMKGFRNRALWADYASNAMTVAPAGSGKGIFTVVNMGLAIRFAKLFVDFKGELICILKPALEARGEICRWLNPGNLWEDQLGEGDCYNPLDLIVDCLHTPGALRDLPDVLREFAGQALKEPGKSESENTYFREGGRRAIVDITAIHAMVDEYNATLSNVALTLEDRNAFEHHMRWVVGVDLEGKPLPEGPMPIEQTAWAQKHDRADVAEFARWIRARAANWISLLDGEGRTFDSFISGSQQALAPFATGRLATITQRSTFSMSDLKRRDQITNLFLVVDASRMETYKSWIEIMQWCALTTLKRHPDKSQPVYLILDEVTNYAIAGLASLLTWGRSFGIRLHLIFQDLTAFERQYGKEALETLQSETEIKQFLPGQRSPKTLELISKMLGERTEVATGRSPNDIGINYQMSDTTRAQMTPDEIRRSEDGLLFVRQAPPVRFKPISYAEIAPWRDQVGINPFHGKPFRKKVRLKVAA